MIKNYLENAIKDITKLIDITNKDIEDAKEANHDNISNRVDEKNHLTISFETNKSLLNDELTKLPDLASSLSSEEKELLEELKENLKILKEKNKVYAKFVIKLNEFYTSLFDEMFALDRKGYKVTNATPANLLKVSA